MLKRMSLKKLFVSFGALFALFLIYLIPSNTTYSLKDSIKQELEYTNVDINKSPIYLLDSDNYLALTDIIVSSEISDIEARAKELLEILINDGEGESKIPSGFRAVLPSETKILSVKYENNVLKVNFSKELLNVEKKDEERIVEAIVYSLTTIENVDKIIIYIDGEILTKLPKTSINLPSTLDRNFGINKEYNINSTTNINQVNVYYINKYNKDYYYVPVTKYLNDDREKIQIVIDELSSGHLYNTNLMSFLNSNTRLLAVENSSDVLTLMFNQYIFDEIDSKTLLEEVIYTISLSIADNYDVKEVIFMCDNEQIYKSVLKTIE